ncbi:MAG: translation initiation factor IF-2 [Ktedonobacteraceae bacterium]
MRNTSESPEGNEQAKPTSTRTRASARSKSDSATPGSQEQPETKPVTRRRTGSTPVSNSTPAISAPDGTERASTLPESAPRPAPAQRSRAATPLTQKENTPTSTEPTTRPTPRSGGTTAPSRATAPATPKENTSTSTEPTARPTQPVQRSAHRTNAPVQRTGGTGAPAQRGGNAGMPGRSNTGSPVQRASNTVVPAQRPPNSGPYQQRQPNQGGAFTQHQGHPATQQRPANRPGNGSATTGMPRPTTGTPGRPGTGRPGGPGHPAPARPGTRPGTPTQRPQERRVAAVKEKPTGPIAIPPQIVVKDLAELLQATPNEIIRGLIKHSIFASINQVVEYDKAALVAQEMGFEPHQGTLSATPAIQSDRGLSANEVMMASRNEDNMIVIPPVVTIMGHVDHGKTSLLDTIRKTRVAAGEAGGITQHIGAYQVEVDGKKITFLDTPGHEAFTAMRARGAQVTHIAVIVVAADDGVMPQTREAIDHAQAAKVPIIIALNKIDKEGANPDHVKQQLAEIGLIVEEYGGDIVSVPVSARKGTGINDLLEMILLVAEVQDIKADPNRLASGVIIEARLEKNTGPTATVLIQQGTLKMGDNIVVGSLSGKIRAMFNDRGKRIQKAPPSTPVSILGLPEVPNAGDRLEAVADDRTAKQKASKVAEQRRNDSMPLGQVSLDTLYMQMQEGKVKELNIVLKSDVQGTSEAIKNALTKVGEENIKVRLIHEGIGNISETDVHLAAASGAIIIGFNVKADGAAQRQAQKEGVDIRYYNVIYKLTDDIQAALTGMLEPTFREVVEGHAEVLQTFKAGKTTVIAGCRITDGKIVRSSQARILRKGEKVYDGKIASLRRGKDDVREVASGYECGIVLEDFTEFEVGDIIEAFSQERVKTGA